MLKFVVLIPTARNDGSLVTEREMDGFFERFALAFNGVSGEGQVNGRWYAADGKLYRDLCERVAVALTEADLPTARELVEQIGRELGQLAMYTEICHGITVEIINL